MVILDRVVTVSVNVILLCLMTSTDDTHSSPDNMWGDGYSGLLKNSDTDWEKL